MSFEPKIVAFCCQWCAYGAADLAGVMRMQYPVNIRIVRVPCTGRVEILHILSALSKGADAVMVAGCLEGGCHFTRGNLLAKRRVEHTKRILEGIGIGAERVQMFFMSASMASSFVEAATQMTENIRKIGPSPLR